MKGVKQNDWEASPGVQLVTGVSAQKTCPPQAPLPTWSMLVPSDGAVALRFLGSHICSKTQEMASQTHFYFYDISQVIHVKIQSNISKEEEPGH